MVWKSFPARLVINSAKGFAICVCLIDFVYFDMNTLNPESLSPQRVVSLSKVPVEVEASIAKEFMKPNSIALNEFQLMSWAPLSSIAKALIQDGFDVDFQALSSVAASVSSSDKSEFLEFVIQFLLSKLGSKDVKWYTAVSEIPHETGHTILLFPCCAEALISADIKLRKKEAKAEKKSKDDVSHSSTEQSSKPKSKAPPLHRKLAPIFLKNSGSTNPSTVSESPEPVDPVLPAIIDHASEDPTHPLEVEEADSFHSQQDIYLIPKKSALQVRKSVPPASQESVAAQPALQFLYKDKSLDVASVDSSSQVFLVLSVLCSTFAFSLPMFPYSAVTYYFSCCSTYSLLSYICIYYVSTRKTVFTKTLSGFGWAARKKVFTKTLSRLW